MWYRTINKLNSKLLKLKMFNTNFTNAAGFDIGEHYTTLNDLLKLTEYAIQNKTFNHIVQLKNYSFKRKNSNSIYSLKNHNKLLFDNKEFIGIKKLQCPHIVAENSHIVRCKTI